MRTRKHRGFMLALVVVVEAVQEAEKAMCGPIPFTIAQSYKGGRFERQREGVVYFDISSSYPAAMVNGFGGKA